MEVSSPGNISKSETEDLSLLPLTAHVTVEGVKYLVAFIRDAKKVVVKNDLLLNESDLRAIKEELAKFIKKADTTKKGRK